jgi:hypothetical protein
MPEEKPVCPKCGSDLLVRLGNQTHCNSCGKSHGLIKDPIGEAARRARAARSEKTGWHKHGREFP